MRWQWIRMGVAATGLLALAPATMTMASAAPVSPQPGNASTPSILAAATPRVPG